MGVAVVVVRRAYLGQSAARSLFRRAWRRSPENKKYNPIATSAAPGTSEIAHAVATLTGRPDTEKEK
jgi:hypothetical protein